MKIADIKTELFSQTTICDYGKQGVRLLYFDEQEWKRSQLPENCKQWYITEISILCDKINMTYKGRFIKLSPEQVDEIQRISAILRTEMATKEKTNND
jgi:hypothetical protein